ncbi:YchJ family protein [Reichenbachiella sp.]|uniref:YchJ family protein n=1 Tax=Reichenbachiella sp. TaxID=2184521 RepID=UPI003BB1FD31
MNQELCPCGSNRKLSDCCGGVISSKSAKTALQLMKSRYAAYSIGEAQYLLDTTHKKNRSAYSIEGIEQWSKENTWTKLEIVSVEHGSISDDRGLVEFKAHFTDPVGENQVHHERSSFLKDDGKWYYLDGQINPKQVDLMKKIHRNDPCPCGSGKKYKKCCG